MPPRERPEQQAIDRQCPQILSQIEDWLDVPMLMLMTEMGADYALQTAEGRLLYFVLAVYAFVVFGYVTATLATLFIDRDADDNTTEIVGARAIAALHAGIVALRAEIQNLNRNDL